MTNEICPRCNIEMSSRMFEVPNSNELEERLTCPDCDNKITDKAKGIIATLKVEMGSSEADLLDELINELTK